MGMRAALRAGTEIQALAFHQPSARAYFKKLASGPLTDALSARDQEFGDYRVAHGDERSRS
jgi:enoyl-CoA hydratase